MSNQIDITGGARVRNLNGVITGSTGVLSSLPINGANGIPQLDSSGKILVSQLPNSVMEFLGTWNAATNTPTLVNGTGNAGDVYLCTVAGTVNFGAGPITFQDGDYVVYSGSTWERSSGAMGTVTSVGASITGNSIGITGSPVTTAGTLAFAFAGTSGQYINGAGNLVTFPALTGYVPYSGATGNVNLGEWGITSGYYGFDITPTGTPTSVGTMFWDSFYRTPSVITGTSATTLQLGQEQVTLVHNNTGATLTDGQVVYVTGSTGELPSVALATNTTEAASSVTFGVVTESIPHGSDGFVTTSGMIHGLNTLAFTEGQALWLGATAGTFTNVKPVAPANSVLIGYVIKRAGGNGSIFVKIQNGYELEELHDVLISGVTNNEGLFWDSATSLWKNKTIATALGYTPANDSLVVHLAGAETITGSKTFTSGIVANSGTLLKQNVGTSSGAGYTSIYSSTSSGLFNLNILNGNSLISTKLQFQDAGAYTYTFPAETGTLALTSNLSSYVPYTGAIDNVDLGNNSLHVDQLSVNKYVFVAPIDLVGISNNGTIARITVTDALTRLGVSPSSYVPYTGATGNVNLGNYGLTTSNVIISGGTGTTGSLMFGQSDAFAIPANGFSSMDATTTGFDYAIAIDASNSKRFRLEASGLTNNTWRTYTLPNASGTIALVGGSGVGTVTSVAALTIGTSGTDLSSTVANSTTTPVITLNVPTASATNRGALSSADWTTFNNKQATITLTTTGTSGAATFSSNTLNIPQYQAAGTYVTSVTGTSPIVSSGGTTPAISITQATTSTNGYLSSTDWTTFNNKQNALTNPVTGTGTTNYLPKFTGTSTIGNSLVYDNGTNVGVNLTTPLSTLHVNGTFEVGYVNALNNAMQFSWGGSSTYGRIQTYSSSILQLNPLGNNVEIGYSTVQGAGYKLDVNGTGRFASTLRIDGTSSSRISLENNYSGGNVGIALFNTSGTENIWLNAANGSLNCTGPVNGGAATFSSSVTAGSNINLSNNTGLYIKRADGTLGQAFFLGSSNELNIGYGTADVIRFGTYLNDERMRITSGGRVGIGQSSPYTNLHIKSGGNNLSTSTVTFLISGTNGLLLDQQSNTNNFGSMIWFNNDELYAAIGSGRPSNGNWGTDLRFYTHPDSTTNQYDVTERMRITSGGVMQIANASGTLGTLVGSERLNVNGGIYAYNGITSAGILTGQGVYVGTSTPSDASLRVELTSGYAIKVTRTGLDRFWVDSDGAGYLKAAAWTYGSDLRLKENIKDVVNGIDTIIKLKPKHFDYIDGVKNNLGFIAQEIKDVIPQAVSNISKDSDLLGLKTDFIVPYLVKAIQELKAEIEILKNK